MGPRGVLLLLLLLLPVRSIAGQMSVVPCTPGNSSRAVQWRFTPEEFLHAFRDVFTMSDGSSPVLVDDSGAPMLSLVMEHVLSLMGDVGVRTEGNGSAITLCEGDVLRLCMLAALGNFVTAPEDPEIGRPGTVATVVLDVYTRRLVVVTPYTSLRAYFLETLLVLSIVAVARLAMVREVTVHMGAG